MRALLLTLALAAGCGASPASPPLAAGCPRAEKAGGYSTIDYVDFVHANGRDYYAGMTQPAPTAAKTELGAQAFTVRCSFSAFNHATGQNPGSSRDGDAAFLQAGTPVYELTGWPATCRLAAEVDGQVRVYLAYRTDTATAEPEPCALKSTG